MVFAGLTSAYIVRRNSGEWIFFDLPNQFFFSAILLLITSLLLHKSYYVVKGNKIEELLIRGTTRIVLWSFGIHIDNSFLSL